MKAMLRQLRQPILTHLAFTLGVLMPYNTEKELVDTIADYCADHRLNWSDLLSRFSFLQSPDVRKEIMTAAPGQTASGGANSCTERLASLRDTNPVETPQAPIEGLSSSARAVKDQKPHTRAIIALTHELAYHRLLLKDATTKEKQEEFHYYVQDLTNSIAVLQRESNKGPNEGQTR